MIKYTICTLIASAWISTGLPAVQPVIVATSMDVVVPVKATATQVDETSQEPERFQKTRMSFGSRGTKVAKNALIGTAIVVGVCAVLVVGGTALVIWAFTGFVPLGI